MISLILSLADYHLQGKGLFTWLSLMVSLVVTNFVVMFSQRVSWKGFGIVWCQFLRMFQTITVYHKACLSVKVIVYSTEAAYLFWYYKYCVVCQYMYIIMSLETKSLYNFM